MKSFFTKKLLIVILSILFLARSIETNAKYDLGIGSIAKKYDIEKATKKASSSSIAGLSDLSLAQTVNTNTALSGNNVTFTLTLTNDGQTNVSGVVVTDMLPSGATLVSATPSAGTTNLVGNTLTWQVGNVSASSPALTLAVVITLNNSGVFYNSAEISAMNETDIDSTPNNKILSEDDNSSSCTSVPYKYCVGEQIQINVSADAGYSNYQWYKNGVLIAGATSQNYTITSIGSYNFTADVSAGISSCNGSLCCPIIVENYPAISLTNTATQPTCATANGSVVLTYTGGVSPFTYSKDGTSFVSTNSFTNLGAGAYTFTVKDGNGCTATTSVTLQSIAGPSLVAGTVIQPSCNLSNGSVTVNGTGGSGALTYSVDNGVYGSTNIFTNLSVGSHTFSVKDGNGCIGTLNVVLTNQGSNVNLTNSVVCDNLGNGTVSLTASGGTSPYQYSNGTGFVSTNVFSNVLTGTYTYTAKDANGCVATTTASVSCNVTCTSVPYKYCVGEQIQINASAGAGNSNYQWYKNGVLIAGATSQTYTITSIGSYTFTADVPTGSSSCSGSLCCPIVVENYPAISLTNTATQPTCATANGSVELTPAGGVSPFTYSKDGISFVSTNSFTSLGAGAYTFTVKDGNGCTATTSVTLQSIAGPSLVAGTVIQPSCNLSNGSVTVNGTGGSGALTYSVDNGVYGSTNIFTNLSVGSHTFSVKDGNGCIGTLNVVLTNQGSNVNLTNSVVCDNLGNGTVSLTASGGTSPYQYSNGTGFVSTNVFSNVLTGTYTYTAKDANGCVATTTASVSCNATCTSVPYKYCVGEQIQINASAGAGNSNYQWYKNGVLIAGATSQTYTITSIGSYTFTADVPTGSSSCSGSLCCPIIVENYPAISLTSTATQPTCATANGSVVLTPAGGVSPFTYSKDGISFVSTNSFTSLGAGAYTFTVKDGNGCIGTLNVVLTNQGSNVNLTNSVVCDNLGNGTVSLTASGGTSPYQYSNGTGFVSTNVFSNVLTGTYTYTAKDANGCIATTTASVSCNVTCTSVPYKYCVGEQIQINASAGAGNSNYQWYKNGVLIAGATSQTYTITSIGSYTFTADVPTGSSSCSGSLCCPIIVENYPAISLTSTATQPNCTVTSTGSIIANTSGGTAPFTYKINNGLFQSSNIFNGLLAGNYIVTVQDANGCTASANVVQISQVLPPNAPLISSDKTSICGNEVAILTASNCTGIITWSNGSNQNPISVSTSGNYTATCTNACGMSVASNVIQINKGAAPNAPLISSDKTSICGNEVAILTASNCTGVITWSNGSNQNPISVSTSGNYTATCTNACGISVASNVIQINKGAAPNAPLISSDKTSICGNEVAILTASNCTGVITWSNGSNQNPISASTSGNYTATCTNACGTSVASNTIQINKGAAPNSPFVSSDKTSICGNEVAILTASNCTGIITWSNGSNQNPISVSTSGNYTATCTNACGISVASNVIQINKGAIPNAPLISSDKTSICGNEVAILTASNCIGIITWSNGSNQNPISISTSGNYTATCTNACGISVASNVIQINKGAAPNAPLISSDKTSICGNEVAILTASNCTGVITWSNGSNQNPISVSTSGNYTATCTNACGTSVASQYNTNQQRSSTECPID
jgi:trimeric autotransporter adhesin